MSSSTLTVRKGNQEVVTIRMRPAESLDGWLLEFRAKSAAVNPKVDATTAAFPSVAVATYLTDDIDDETTQLSITTTRGFPLEGPFKVQVDNEIMQVTDGVGWYGNGELNTLWTVERGMWGTTAAEHLKRARVTLWYTPQILLDNGSHGGVSVIDADLGIIEVAFDATMTNERPVGTYWWNLRRTGTGYERTIAEGVLYLVPTVNSAFQEPPLHNG